MDSQNIPLKDRIQAAAAHLLIIFLLAASTLIPFAEPVFHSRGKFLPLDLLIEWSVNMTIKWDDGFFLIFFINFLVLLIWSKKAPASFVREHIQQAFNFALITLLVSIIARYSFLSNITPARIQELLELASDPKIEDSAFYLGFLLKISPYLIWYGITLESAIKSIRGQISMSFVNVQLQLPFTLNFLSTQKRNT